MLLMSSADLFQKIFQEHYQSVKLFGRFVGPDLRPNCLQTTKLAASKERVNLV